MKNKKRVLLSLLCVTAIGAVAFACNAEEESNFEFEQTDGGYAVCGVKEIEKGKIEIPSVYKNKSVVAISDGAFEDEDGLVTVVIPDSVRYVGVQAFADCNKLETIRFGTGVTAIRNGAFKECVSIKEISLPESLAELGDNVFNGCESLKEISIPDNVKSIGDYSFVGCESLKNVEIGDSLEWIGQEAFAGNKALLTVSISEAAPLEIGTKAFYECKELLSVKFGGTVAVGSSAFQKCSHLAEVELGDNCVSVGANAFSSCVHLTGVTVGKSVVNIDSNAFSSCNKLVEVYNRSVLGFMPGDEAHGKIAQDALHVYTEEGQSRRFKDDKGVVYYKDGERVIALGQVGFETGLDIVLDERTTEVYPMAFYNNLNVSSVTFGDKVQKIGRQAFNFCYKLRKIVIGDGVTEIADKAFNRCDIMNMVVLGENVKTVGVDVFDLCHQLPSGNVYYKGDALAFSNIQVASGNANLLSGQRYYYSATQPTDNGKYWYYDETGKMRVWS